MHSFLVFFTVAAAGLAGFFFTRRFVYGRLRFVDAVYSPWAPWVVGILTALLAWPAALLPVITHTATALLGIGAGLGTASAVKRLKQGQS